MRPLPLPNSFSNREEVVRFHAYRLGFQYCGISEAGFLEEEAPRLEQWLKSGQQGTMRYMENHFDKRLDPRLLVEGARSVVTLLYNYQTESHPKDQEAPKISRYAYGEDYHRVIKDKLFELVSALREEIGAINGRVFVDSAPVLEKAWAKKSGVGWIGKNSNLITRNDGSWFFLAELITDLELVPDGPIKDYCGRCNRCVEACPTSAITPYQVDGSKCISYLTIELKEAIPEEFKGNMQNWAFGCDICQEVCPWNRFAKAHSESRFSPSEELLGLTKKDWMEMTDAVFGRIFEKSAVQRAGYDGLMRSLNFLYDETASPASDGPFPDHQPSNPEGPTRP